MATSELDSAGDDAAVAAAAQDLAAGGAAAEAVDYRVGALNGAAFTTDALLAKTAATSTGWARTTRPSSPLRRAGARAGPPRGARAPTTG